MKFTDGVLILAFVLFGGLPVFAQDHERADARSTVQSTYTPVHTFDDTRNAAADIDQAIAEATKTGKRILLDIGGDWCSWCHKLDELLRGNPDLVKLREDNFITVAIYCGPNNKNQQILSQYPQVLGIPHFFVLEKDGTLLYSQRMVELQTEGSYSPDKMKEFLTKWSPSNSGPAKGDSDKTREERSSHPARPPLFE
ncbi:MAG TPA: thioredoxin family protein [Candidatus Binatia bacterium]|nr:thioredoxin family protein [Candidatus Binatia bacterium]